MWVHFTITISRPKCHRCHGIYFDALSTGLSRARRENTKHWKRRLILLRVNRTPRSFLIKDEFSCLNSTINFLAHGFDSFPHQTITMILPWPHSQEIFWPQVRKFSRLLRVRPIEGCNSFRDLTDGNAPRSPSVSRVYSRIMYSHSLLIY